MVLSDEIQRNIVYETDSIATALRKIGVPNHWRTLFVLDDQQRVVGSISDGDIRRGLSRGRRRSAGAAGRNRGWNFFGGSDGLSRGVGRVALG